MWPVTRFYEPELKNMPSQSTTTTIIKHIHEYLPLSIPPMQQTAIKAVSIATATLFIKLWITASMEGRISQRPPEDMEMLNYFDSDNVDEQTILNEIKKSLQKFNPNNNDNDDSPSSDINLRANALSSADDNKQNNDDNNNVNDSQQISGQKQKQKQKRKTSILYNIGYRLKGTIRNDLENIPITLIIAWGSLYAKSNYKVTTYSIAMFTISRCLHSYYYIKQQQPHRTIAFCFGLFSTFMMAINLLWSVFKKQPTKSPLSVK